jgi:tRNA threonylcarbamoyladenosine biosynthesis protein TsaB
LKQKAYLALDTSTDIASFALKLGDELYTTEQAGVATHAEKCLTHIETLLQQAGIDLGHLSGMIVGRGPGSFTGLRVACSVVKGLAYGQRVPIYPVSNLGLLAWQASLEAPNYPILSVMDARMQQVYWAYYAKPFAATLEHVSHMHQIKLPDASSVILAGYNIQEMLQQLPTTITYIEYLDLKPKAQEMIRMVETGNIQAISAETLEPTYVRDQVTHGSING